MRTRSSSAVVCAMVMAGLMTGAVQADTYTWDGGGADNNFSTANNWSSDAAPADIVNHSIAFGALVSPFRTTANNNLTGNPFSFTFNAGAAAMTITADSGKELQFAGGSAIPIVNNSANVQTFSSDVRQFWDLAGNRTWNANTGDLSFTNVALRGDLGPTANNTWMIGGASNTLISGTITKENWSTGGPSLIKTNTGILTLSNNSNVDTVTIRGGKLRLTGGTLSTTKRTSVGSNLGIQLASGTLEVAGGNINVTTYGLGSYSPDTGTLNVTAGNVTVARALIVGWNTSPTFTVSGGTLAAGSIYHNDAGSGILSISGTGIVTAGNVYLDSNGGGVDSLTLNLNAGGTLAANSLYMTLGDKAQTNGTHSFHVNFNGGTLKAGASGILISTNPAVVTVVSSTRAINVTVKAGGAVIDTNGKTVSILQPLLHDSGLGAAPDGGLTKTGAGTLTLAVANTYSGATAINEGTLSLSQPNTSNDGSDFTMASGATLDLTFTGTDTVKKLFIGGKWRSAGVYGASGSASPIIGISQITGNGTLTVTIGPGTFISLF